MKKFAAILVFVLVCFISIPVGAITTIDKAYHCDIQRDGIKLQITLIKYREFLSSGEWSIECFYYVLSGRTNADSVVLGETNIPLGQPDINGNRGFNLDLRNVGNMNPFFSTITSYKGDSFVAISLESETSWYISDSSALTGDLNRDGEINSTDYTYFKRSLLRIIYWPDDYFEAADLNGDGSVDSTDYTLLKRFLLKTIDRFPKDVIAIG
ncbi:MAG: dockerin type I repeat-containing protein [Bacillota bacterium]